MIRDNPFNELAKQLNRDRKACLQLLYNMVDSWQAAPTEADRDQYEKEIHRVFQKWRLQKIVFIGLVMDRAQSLYSMKIHTSRFVGMHWYCDSHLDARNEYGVESLEEQNRFRFVLTSQGYQGEATMNKRLYKVVHRFGLLHPQEAGSTQLARWSRPALAVFEEELRN